MLTLKMSPTEVARARDAERCRRQPARVLRISCRTSGEELLERLAAAKINVTAMDAVSVGGGRHGAIFWVDPKDVKNVASLLGASAAA
jgi:Ni,Fe-hydrogenase maturation factor